MRDISGKCRENQNAFTFNNLFPKIVPFVRKIVNML